MSAQMKVDSVTIVNEFFALARAGREQDLMRILSPGWCARIPPGLPFSGEHRGHAGASYLLAAFRRAWSEFAAEGPVLIGDAERVVVMFTFRGRARETGIAVEMPMVEVFRVADGLITEMRVFYFDADVVREALAARSGTRRPGGSSG